MPETEDSDILAAKFSSKLIGVLKAKVRSHNKNCPPDKKVSLSQLKQVYSNSAQYYDYAGYSRSEWCLARVNTFLQSLLGNAPSIMKGREEETLGGLKFKSKIIEANAELDCSRDWIPSQQDFTQAKQEIKDNELFYNFSDVSELYLEDYKPCSVRTY
tara:strand:+ start:444 stop:917 length:474 start_codon:yes stop_codon:yes gene_type:complete